MDTISVLVKAPGQPPEEVENLAQALVIAVPVEDPEHNCRLIAANFDAKALIATGNWLVQAGAAIAAGKEIPPFGEAAKMRKNIANRPGNKIVTPDANGRFSR